MPPVDAAAAAPCRSRARSFWVSPAVGSSSSSTWGAGQRPRRDLQALLEAVREVRLAARCRGRPARWRRATSSTARPTGIAGSAATPTAAAAPPRPAGSSRRRTGWRTGAGSGTCARRRCARSGDGRPLLRELSSPQVVAGRVPRIGQLAVGEHGQQGGLAGAVRPDDAQQLARERTRSRRRAARAGCRSRSRGPTPSRPARRRPGPAPTGRRPRVRGRPAGPGGGTPPDEPRERRQDAVRHEDDDRDEEQALEQRPLGRRRRPRARP